MLVLAQPVKHNVLERLKMVSVISFAIHHMSSHVVSDIHSRAEGEILSLCVTCASSMASKHSCAVEFYQNFSSLQVCSSTFMQAL